jgi:hypothetical protein
VDPVRGQGVGVVAGGVMSSIAFGGGVMLPVELKWLKAMYPVVPVDAIVK